RMARFHNRTPEPFDASSVLAMGLLTRTPTRRRQAHIQCRPKSPKRFACPDPWRLLMLTFKHIGAAAIASIFVVALAMDSADARRGGGGGGGARAGGGGGGAMRGGGGRAGFANAGARRGNFSRAGIDNRFNGQRFDGQRFAGNR